MPRVGIVRHERCESAGTSGGSATYPLRRNDRGRISMLSLTNMVGLMSSRRALSLLTLVFPLFVTLNQDALAQTPSPPVAAERPVELEIHGDVRVDSYYWLRERDNPEVIAYLEAENAYFESRMAPLSALQNELFEELRDRVKEDDESVPYRLGDHYYYHRFEAGNQYPIYARRAGSLDAPEQVLLDVNVLAEGHDFYSVSAGPSSVSPDGRYLAWAADTSGRRFYTIRFLDMETGHMLDEVIASVTPNVAWASDSRSLFYAKQDPETLRRHRIFRHIVGSEAVDDVMVYEETDPTFSVSITRSQDGQFLLMGSRQTMAMEWRFLDADNPEGQFELFLPRERGHEYSIDHGGDHFYVLTNRDAENFRLMRTPTHATAEDSWVEIVPHRDDVLLTSFTPFENHLVLAERRAGLNSLRILPDADPARSYSIAFDDAAYNVSLGTNPEFETNVLRYVYQSPTTPSTSYDFDMETRERTLVKQDEVLGGFDSADYRAERLTVPARDGQGVPVTLVYRTDAFTKDGSQPLLLYGYGSYGSSIAPNFNRDVVSLLDRGFVYAIAHIRGSETLGRRWYEDGKLLNKKNTFTDFIDVGDHLIAEGYADPERMYAMGGSAGGLLVGAVMNMRPDLFDGIIAHVPWVDVVTTMLDDTIPLTTSEYDEWGNPNDPEFYDYMLSYSPYDQVRETEYPNLLVTTGLHDSQVQYWEPAKWVARLRALKTDDNLLLLHTNMGAGHGGATGRYDRFWERARDYSFLLHLADRERSN
jgi:oligopeptidase B